VAGAKRLHEHLRRASEADKAARHLARSRIEKNFKKANFK
jgi:hypothetical protein